MPVARTAAQTLLAVPGLRPDQQLVVADLADNYAGSHTLPVAAAVLDAAADDGWRSITVGSAGGYGLAVAATAWRAGIHATIVQPAGRGDHGAAASAFGADIVHVDGGHENAVTTSRQLAAATGAADGNLDGPYHEVAVRALTTEFVAFASQLPAPAAMWIPAASGLTTVAAGAALQLLSWPSRLYAVTSAGNNAILASWPSTYTHLPPSAVAATPANRPLACSSTAHGPAALTAVHTHHGRIAGVTDAQLKDAAAKLAAAHVAASPAGAAGLAGLLAARDAEHGTHLIVITDRPGIGAS